MLRHAVFGSLMGIGLMLTAGAHASPLVTNGGFETSNFTAWANFGDGVSIDNVFPNNGLYDAAFSASSFDPSPGALSQAISTSAGASYNLDFYLLDEAFSPSDSFSVAFGGFSTTITGDQAFSFSSPSFYSQFSYVIPGSDITSSSTSLSFSGQNNSGQAWNLDDVSLACTSCTAPPSPVPAPPSGLLLASGLLLLFGLRAVRRGQSGHKLAAV